MTTAQDRQHYVAQVIDLYCGLPDTSGYARPADRQLATDLCDRGIALAVVEEALLLASVRRNFRAPDAPPLAPVRSLHYYLPVIDELLHKPLPSGYRDYLIHKLRILGNRRRPAPPPTPTQQDP